MLPICILMPFRPVRSCPGMSGRVNEAVSASSRWARFFPCESVPLHSGPGGAAAPVAAAERDISHGTFFDSPADRAASDNSI